MAQLELTVNSKGTGVRIVKADGFLTRLTGLMGKAAATPGLLITHCNSVHTCFMRVTIDVVFVGAGGKVVKVVPGLKPWRMLLPVRTALNTLELENGAALRLGIREGGILTFPET